MKLLGQAARLAVSFIIIFQLSFGHALASSGDGGNSFSTKYNSADSYSLKIIQASNMVEDGTFFKQSPKNFDAFLLVGQRVEFYQNGQVAEAYPLNDPNREKSTITPTSIKPHYNPETRELYFDFNRGALADGSGGQLVARHIIPDMDIVAMDYDKELLMFVDKKGSINAIDMESVIYESFKSPIPVFKNLWSPSKNLNLVAGETRAELLTRGVQPTAAELNPAESVVPLNEKGEADYRAGGLLVRYNENGKEKILGLFARSVTKKTIADGIDFLISIRELVSSDAKQMEYYKSIAAERERAIQLNADQIITASQRMGGPIDLIQIDQLERLGSRLSDLRENNPLMTDTFTHNEWVKDYESFKNSASDPKKLEQLAKNSQHLQNTAGSDERKKILRDLYDQWLVDAQAQKRLATPFGLAKGYQVFEVQTPRVDPLSKPGSKPKLPKKIRSDSSVLWAMVGVITASTAAYLSGAFVYTSFESLQQLQFLNWVYENIYPSVMKDAIYRVPLSKSVFAWVSVIPLSLATSAAVGRAIDLLAAVNKNTTTAFGNYVRELQKTWGGDKDAFQRITTAGLRLWSFFITPYLRGLISKVLDQKAFLPAYENGINPLRRIKANSPEGQALGLTKNEFVGLIDPYLDQKHQKPVLDRKEKIQSALKNQAKRLESLAWILATLAVSDKTQIDPATILQVTETRATPEQIRAILNDPAKYREWQILAQEIEADLKSKNALTIQQEVNSLSPEKIAEYYAAAKDAAAKIQAQSEFKQKAYLRWKTITTSPIRALNYMLLENGKADAEFLRTLTTNKFVAGQVRQEFISDHLWVTYLPAFWGDRADLTQPTNLTADPNRFMWTSAGHEYDMVINTKTHFVDSGTTMALVFMKLEAERESLYLPKESLTEASDPRPEGLWKGIKNWVSYGYNEREKDIGRDGLSEEKLGKTESVLNYAYNFGTQGNVGELMAKRLLKRATTVQGAITTAILFRSVIAGQSVAEAMAAFALVFTFGHWVYGWQWDIIQRGNQMIEQRLGKNDAQFETAKYKIKVGFKESNMELVNQGYNEMRDLYLKYNPQALNKLKAILDFNMKKNFKITLDASDSKVKLTDLEKDYIGVLAKLAKANYNYNPKDKNTENSESKAELNSAMELLRNILVTKQGFDRNEVAKLNAESLLEFAVTNPPVFTHPNKFLSETFTWIGAASTTAMYIPLSIMLFDPESLQWHNIFKFALLSAGLYVGAWLTTGKTPWLYYEKIYKKSKEKAAFEKDATREAAPRTERVQEVQLPLKSEPPKPRFVLARSCSSLFN